LTPTRTRRTQKPKPKAQTKPRDPSQPSTRDISFIVKDYLTRVRAHDASEYRGIYRQIMLLVKKGVLLADIRDALQNYANNDFVRNSPQHMRHHIRRFFMMERIKQWMPKKTADESLAALGRMQTLQAGDAPTIPTWKPDDEEEPECSPEI
jgi:hypothetical protein